MRQKLTQRNEQTGFTIIEVVLVLAIAGLIFLIVFLALPQLQRSRRDTQRKSDAGRFLSAAETYAGNHNGNYGTFAETTALLQNWNDPSTGSAYVNQTAIGNVDAAGEVFYAASSRCNATTGVFETVTPAQNRSIAIAMYQEAGGVYCQDNQ